MSTEVSDDDLKKILQEIDEVERLRGLSNEALVREVLKLEFSLHVEELCNRVWPNWDKAEL